MADHQETEVGGAIDEARLIAVVRRGADLRNWHMSDDGARVWLRSPGLLFGETPRVIGPRRDEHHDDGPGPIELHMGCGDCCGVLAELPYDGDVGGWHYQAAAAIVHAGADLLDLAREVQRLRVRVAELELELMPDMPGVCGGCGGEPDACTCGGA